MSRWLDQFQSHPFQAAWVELKENLKTSKVDDETVITSVIEIARLKKVIAYLDEMIKGVDPELVPMATWDSFQQQAAPCSKNIILYNNNRNISHINQANAHADNLLSYVRPYMISPGSVGDALQKAVQSYVDVINNYSNSFVSKANELVNEIKSSKEEGDDLLQSIIESKSKVDEIEVELLGGEDKIGLKKTIDNTFEDIENKYEAINGYYNETLVGDDKTPSTKKEIADAKVVVIEDRDEISESLESVATEVSELQKFHTKIFGKLNEEDKRVGGLSGDLDNLTQALKDFEGEQKKKYNALNDEINSLLPGATSAGLATAYKDMKNSFDQPIKHASKVFYWSIGLLVIASVLLAIDTVGGENWIAFVKFESWEVVLKGLVYKIPFYAPVLWLAFYATKRRSEYQRLQQEYAHKEALAKSYNSYKKQIQDLDVKDVAMQKEFIMKAIDAIAYNASETLDGRHGDKMPAQELIEKLVEELAKMRAGK